MRNSRTRKRGEGQPPPLVRTTERPSILSRQLVDEFLAALSPARVSRPLSESLPTAALAAADAVRRRWPLQPSAGLILGTGQGALADALRVEVEIPYGQLPQFPRATALSHRGRLLCGWLAGVPLVTLDGRCHLYEGYPLDQLMLPVYTLRALGAELLIVSNAAGGLNPRLASGDVMVIADHLAFWLGGRWREAGPAGHGRPRAAAVYDRGLIEQALGIARRENFAAWPGVYVAMLGPNFETRAEYRFLRRLGGDAVGMSTVPETIAAARCGLRTLALSIITNVACPDRPAIVCARDVVAAAQNAEAKVERIVRGVLASRGVMCPAG